jgi:bifunctional non-homologous end joining protein LigD
LDGEVIAPDETGWPQFFDFLRHMRNTAYVVFNLLWLNGTDVRPLPLNQRRWRSEGVLPTSALWLSENAAAATLIERRK